MRSAQTRSPSLVRFYVLLASVTLIGAAILLWQLRATIGMPLATVAIDSSAFAQVVGVSIGRGSAPVVVREFADYQCPACADFSRVLLRQLIQPYVQRGEVRFEVFDFPLTSIHHNAMFAAIAVRCAGEQGYYWPFSTLLYAQQSEWTLESVPTPSFLRYASQLGADSTIIGACIRSGRFVKEINKSIEIGRLIGVTGTPTILVGNRLLPNVPTASQLERLITQALNASRR